MRYSPVVRSALRLAVVGLGLGAQVACERVTVTGALVAELQVAPPSASVVAGESVQMSAGLEDSQGNQLGGRTISWSTDDEAVASVAGGLVTGHAEGSTVVRATADGVVGQAVVEVLKAPTVGVPSTSFSFSGSVDGSDPEPVSIAVFNDGTGSLSGLRTAIDYGTSHGDWLTATLAGSSAPTTLTLVASVAGLDAGTYAAVLRIESAQGSTAQINLTLVVGASAPIIVLSEPSVGFEVREGERSPSYAVTVENAGGQALTGLGAGVSYVPGGASGWLTATLSPTEAPAQLSLVADAGGLVPGDYHAEVSVIAAGALNSPVVLPVTLQVTQPPPRILATPDALTFSYRIGESAAEAQAVQVTNGGGGTLSGLSVAVDYGSALTGWLAVSLDRSEAPAAASVSVDPTELPPGSYSADLLFDSPVAEGEPVRVSVLLLVLGEAPAVALSTYSLQFQHVIGDAGPASTPVGVSNSGGGAVTGLVAAVTYPEGQTIQWLTAALRSTTAPTVLDVTPNAAGLAAGTYTAVVRVDATSSGTTPANLAVQFSVVHPPETVPEAPSGLQALPTLQNTISLSWVDNSSTEDSFEIERSDDGAVTWAFLASKAANVTTHLDTGLPPAAAFVYRIRACNGIGCSDWSDPAAAVTLDPPSPPAPPTDLAATAVSHEQVDLAWSDESEFEDAFEVQRSSDGGTSWATVATTGAGVQSFADTGVQPVTEYHYRVRACLLDVCSTYSNVATAVTPEAPAPPSAPSGLVATPVSRNRVDLSWTDTSDDEDQFEINWRRGSSGSWQFQATVPANQTAFSVTGLRKNTPYQFRVRACSENGCSGWIVTQATTPK